MARHVCVLSIGAILFLAAGLAGAGNVNIRAAIRDSVSGSSIPQVRVTVLELAKSFNTRHSSFVFELPSGIYTIMLENPEYETLRRTFEFVTENNELVFALVKISDRERLKIKADSFYMLLDSLATALNGLDWPRTGVILSRVAGFIDPPPYNADSLARVIQAVKARILDSLMAEARAAEDSQRLADAYFYYGKVVEYDSTNEIARQKAAELSAPKPAVPPVSVRAPVNAETVPSDAEIETLYRQGVSKFIAAKYDDAKKIFRKILVYRPGHEKAKDYLRRTQARIDALSP